MSKNDGGPAFPVSGASVRNDGARSPGCGMTLRDWFAGMAMQGLVWPWTEGNEDYYASCARGAYQMADAMLAERGKEAGK